jgi:hypothetical protein
MNQLPTNYCYHYSDPLTLVAEPTKDPYDGYYYVPEAFTSLLFRRASVMKLATERRHVPDHISCIVADAHVAVTTLSFTTTPTITVAGIVVVLIRLLVNLRPRRRFARPVL